MHWADALPLSGILSLSLSLERRRRSWVRIIPKCINTHSTVVGFAYCACCVAVAMAVALFLPTRDLPLLLTWFLFFRFFTRSVLGSRGRRRGRQAQEDKDGKQGRRLHPPAVVVDHVFLCLSRQWMRFLPHILHRGGSTKAHTRYIVFVSLSQPVGPLFSSFFLVCSPFSSVRYLMAPPARVKCSGDLVHSSSSSSRK